MIEAQHTSINPMIQGGPPGYDFSKGFVEGYIEEETLLEQLLHPISHTISPYLDGDFDASVWMI